MAVESGPSGGGGLGGVGVAGSGSLGGGIGIGASIGGLGRGFGEGATIGSGLGVRAGPSLPSFVSESPARGFSSLAGLGPKLEAPSLSFASESLVRGGVEKTMQTYTLNNIKEPTHQAVEPLAEIAEVASQPSTLISVIESFLAEARLNSVDKARPALIEAEAVAEAEHILGLDKPKLSIDTEVHPEVEIQSEPKLPESDLPKVEAIRQEISLLEVNQNATATEIAFAPQPVARPTIEPISDIAAPKNILATQLAIKPQTEAVSTSSVQNSPILVEEGQDEELIEELVEEEVATNSSEEDLENIEERGKELKMSHGVDPKALEKRDNAVEKATMKVQARIVQLAEEKQKEVPTVIDGEKIVEEIEDKQSVVYRGEELNRLDLRGNVPDGGWEANLVKIKARKFNSAEDALQQTPKTLAEDPPVKEGEGKPVTDQNVAISLKYVPEAIHPAHIVYKRVVRKEKRVKIIKNGAQPAQIIPIEEKTIEKNEGTLHPDLAAALGLPQTLDL